MKILDLYGKEVENNLKKGQGYVSSVVLCGDKITYLQCFDLSERQFFVDTCDVLEVGEKVIYTKKADNFKGGTALKLGRGCYSERGKFLGILSDCDICDFTVKKAQIGNRQFLFDRLICGDIYIVKDNKAVGLRKNTTESCENSDNSCGESNSCNTCPHKLFINAVCN